MANDDENEKKWAFERYKGRTDIRPNTDEYENSLKDWGKFILQQSRKGLVPLFITGCGASCGDNGIPNLNDIIGILEGLFKDENKDSSNFSHITQSFENYNQLYNNVRSGKLDRAIVAGLLNAFQDEDGLKEIWKKLNEILLKKIVEATVPPFYQGLANLYQDKKVNAISMTLNFDGLLIRHFLEKKKKAFSLPDEEGCEAYFLRTGREEERGNNDITQAKNDYVEIQVRGDILYVKCQSPSFCPNKIEGKKYSLWSNAASLYSRHDNVRNSFNLEKDELLLCPYCGEKGVSYLSFPGSFEKENDMKKILSIVWRYLAFQVSSVTVVGLSGNWDPLIVAFLGDLLSEREIPLLVVDNGNPDTHIIRDLVVPKIHNSIRVVDTANSFMNLLKDKINSISEIVSCESSWKKSNFEDYYWLKLQVNGSLSNLERDLKWEESRFERSLVESIEKSGPVPYFITLLGKTSSVRGFGVLG
jgi:hypothetical protein